MWENNIPFIPPDFDFSVENKFYGRIENTNPYASFLITELKDTWLGKVKIPNTYKQAMKSPEQKYWQKAIEKEISVMKDRKI